MFSLLTIVSARQKSGILASLNTSSKTGVQQKIFDEIPIERIIYNKSAR